MGEAIKAVVTVFLLIYMIYHFAKLTENAPIEKNVYHGLSAILVALLLY